MDGRKSEKNGMKPVKNLRHDSEENESSVRDEKVFPF